MTMRMLMPALLVVLMSAPAGAQNFSPEMTKAIQEVRLDARKANAIIKAQGQLSELALSDPAHMRLLAGSARLPAEQQIAQMEKDSASAAILKSNGMTGKEYFTGLVALRAAAWSVEGRTSRLSGLSSQANVAFLKANPSILQKFREGEGGGALRRGR